MYLLTVDTAPEGCIMSIRQVTRTNFKTANVFVDSGYTPIGLYYVHQANHQNKL